MYSINGKGSLVRLIAGIFVLGSALLGYFVHEYYLFFTMLVGTMLILSATTGFCPMELILGLFKVKKKEAK